MSIKLIHLNKSIREEKDLEIMKSKVEKQEALLDYIACMADVEIPEDEPIEPEIEFMEGVDLDE